MAQDEAKSQVPSVSEVRRERERNEMTERIMDAAREMFVRDGYEAVTLRKIARAIEYSQGILYQYFKDKQALLEAIIQKDTEDLRNFMLESLKSDNPVELLIEMARKYVTWGATHPNHYHLMLLPPAGWRGCESQDADEDIMPIEQELLSVLHLAVKGAIDRGLFKEKFSDPSLVAATLWAGVHGVVLLEIAMGPKERALMGGKDTTFEARFETLKDVFLDGFLKAAPIPLDTD